MYEDHNKTSMKWNQKHLRSDPRVHDRRVHDRGAHLHRIVGWFD